MQDNGGNAFPACNEAAVNDTMGMTLRDYFAGQALSGISADASATDNMSHDKIATWYFEMANAMLAARSES